MLHANDIRDAIASHRVSDLQSALGVLAVGRPDHSWLSNTVTDERGNAIDKLTREELLIEVCDELEDCHDIMPADLCAALDLNPSSTYAEGAAVIMAED